MLYLPEHLVTEKLKDLIVNQIQISSSSLRKHVFPIFKRNARGRPQIIGSSVLMNCIDSTCLFTAAHVVDEAATSPLLIPSGSSLQELTGRATNPVSNLGHHAAYLTLSYEKNDWTNSLLLSS